MSLYNKYRPKTFDEIIGNQTMIATLEATLAKKNHSHAMLISGPYGSGKTTIARIIANELGCEESDFTELNASAFRGIDTVRDVDRQSKYKSIGSGCRVWLWDEVHMIGSVAAPAMLKMLEDPPQHVYHILATTDPQKLLPTIRSRCAQFEVSLLNEKEMYRLLRTITKKEGQELSQEIFDTIIRSAEGHPRNAIQILDQVLAVDAEERLEVAKKAQNVERQTIELCRALTKPGTPWKKIAEILRGLAEEDEEQIRRAVLGYCNSILLNSENNQAAMVMDEMMQPFYVSGKPMLTWACYKIAKS